MFGRSSVCFVKTEKFVLKVLDLYFKNGRFVFGKFSDYIVKTGEVCLKGPRMVL